MEKYNLNVDSQQLMTYFRQGVTSETKVLPSMSQVQNANELTLQDRKHELLHFISRPIDVYKGIWTTSQSQNDELIPAGLLFPDLLYKNSQYQEKMRGFVGFRGHIRVRLIINAQKFQQGILMAYWIPNYKNLIGKANLIRASLAGKSGCAHVLINCEGGTEQTIEIPYVNQHTFYNSITDQGNYGALFLTVFGQLKSESSPDVGLRIQAWVENPELEYPTSVLPVLTQGVEEESMHTNTADVPNSSATITLDDVMTELKNFQIKPSYMAKTAGNLLQLAGYQKPTNIGSINRSSLRTNSYMANFGGEQMSHKMALAANNELMSMPDAGGSYLDEMNIINICKAPTYYKTFSMSTTDGENKVLFSDNVHPAKFVQTGTSGVMNSTFLGYASACFGQWRGGIKYTFICAKTGFHSGTLRVTFVPGLYSPFDNPTTVPTGIDLDRSYQETYDLRDLTEFSFTVPYTSTREFLNIVNEYSVGEQSVKQRNYSTGSIIVDVFVPLRAPEGTIAQSFDIMVLVAGADDFTPENPVPPNIFPYSDRAIPTSSRKWKTVNTEGISMDEQHNREDAIHSSDDLIGSARLKKELLASALCVGEHVSSIKNLLARAGTFHVGSQTLSSTVYDIAPFDFQAPRNANTLDDPFFFDYIDYYSYLFGFYRGGVRITIDPGFTGLASNMTCVLKMTSSLNNYYPFGDISRASTRLFSNVPKQFLYSPFSTQVVKPSIEGTIEVEIPYYSLSHVTPVLVREQTQDQVEESNYPFPLLTYYISGSAIGNTAGSGNMTPTFYRSCADDFRFQYMLGPPQVHFINYYDTRSPLDPIQFSNVDYRNEPVSRVGNSANGLFGDSFTFAVSPSETLFVVPNQFLAVSAANNEIYAMPETKYGVAWSTTGNHLTVITSSFPVPASGLRFFTNPVSTTGTFPINIAWTSYSVVAPTSGSQAVPQPCCKWVTESISTGTTNITIPSQSSTAIQYGVDFILTKPLLVSKLRTTAPAENADMFFINTGTTVRFSLVGSGSNTSISISLPDNNLTGWIILTLGSNAAIATNTFSPTAVTQF
jgi:hypothetical protein